MNCHFYIALIPTMDFGRPEYLIFRGPINKLSPGEDYYFLHIKYCKTIGP